ncbi:MAG: hypothetical protein KAI24_06865, partial [Planctomycetes bacterium]|nr:hypothetical protein [Planctomycetota bacterium]
MRWTPIELTELREWIDRGLAAASDEVRALYRQMQRQPTKWQLHPWGDLGGGFWVVGVLGSHVVWFNDIEEGFNHSVFVREGEIPGDQYWCNQDELHQCLARLLPLLRRLGP